MKRITLSIADFYLDLQFDDQVPNALFRRMMQFFAPFIKSNGRRADEVLDIFMVRRMNRSRVEPSCNILFKESIKRPLNKFPFEHDYQPNRDAVFMKVRKYLPHIHFSQFLSGMVEPDELIFYDLPYAWLLRDHRQARSRLLLKPTLYRHKSSKSITQAVYFLIAQIAPHFRAVMLHGVGLSRKRKSLLFLGDSGSGKSTLASLLDQGEVISDDAIMIEKKETGLYLSATPFDQNQNPLESKQNIPRTSRRVNAGFFIQKSEMNFLERTRPMEASSIILKNHIHFFRYFPDENVEKTFYFISHLCKTIPFYRLHFKKDSSFWDQIEETIKDDVSNEEDFHE